MKIASLKIGELIFEDPFVLAPLAGVTDMAMRSLCWEAGASLSYTEMVSGKGLWYGDRKTADLLRIGEKEGPVGYQLFGSEPEIMANAVRVLSDMPGSGPKQWGGYTGSRRPVLFDLNAGCPVPKIVKNGEGSALLKDPDRLYDVVSAMVEASRSAAEQQAEGTAPRPVTVKIRKGFGREDNCAVEVARAAEAAGAAAVTVHGRTREQYYDGRADWQVIADVKAALRIPVIGNGDVMSGADAIAMMEQTGCDGVMIARGALGNPWIFRQAAALRRGDPVPEPPGIRERTDMLLRHIDLACEDKGERIAVRQMRKHIGWYIRGIPGAAAIRRQVNAIEDIDELKRVIRALNG